MKTALHQRLGAVGMTAAIAVLGGGTLLRKCSPPPPAPTAAPVAAPATAVGGILPIDAELVASVNSVRAANGLAPVAENGLLDRAAEDHSIDMAQRQTLTHTGWDGSTPGQRIAAAGYAFHTWGEVVAFGQPTVAAVMDVWMNSSGHRAIILSPDYTEIGVAGVPSATGAIYWTMDFAAPK